MVASTRRATREDYQREVQVILLNTGTAPFTVERGIRGQGHEVETLPEAGRGAGGFSSTGQRPPSGHGAKRARPEIRYARGARPAMSHLLRVFQ